MALGLGVAGAAFAAPHISPAIAKALADPSRPADDRALDAVRKPAEVMAYAGIHPGEHVAEYLPGGGYYTRLLSDAVGPTGKIFALETTTWKGSVEAEQKVLAEPGRGNVVLDSATLGDFHLAEKVDLFWTTLNYHDLHIAKYANVDMAVFNKHVYDSLKPGGLYVIEDHAAATGTGATLSPTLHRIEKAQVIKEVTAAGFKLVGESDVLANASDDHAKPVFDLKFKTDQFILKFRKP
jgi:predicted methyltransferase